MEFRKKYAEKQPKSIWKNRLSNNHEESHNEENMEFLLPEQETKADQGWHMTSEERIRIFNKLAPIVYGRFWKTDICKHLEFGRRVLDRWRKGDKAPRVVIVRLLILYHAHGYSYDRTKGKMVRSDAVKQ